jgi:hypothetical protein
MVLPLAPFLVSAAQSLTEHAAQAIKASGALQADIEVM